MMEIEDFVIKAEPFSWNDNFSELALEDFDSIRDKLSYCACQSIGMALTKLKMIENGELEVRKNNGRKES